VRRIGSQQDRPLLLPERGSRTPLQQAAYDMELRMRDAKMAIGEREGTVPITSETALVPTKKEIDQNLLDATEKAAKVNNIQDKVLKDEFTDEELLTSDEIKTVFKDLSTEAQEKISEAVRRNSEKFANVAGDKEVVKLIKDTDEMIEKGLSPVVEMGNIVALARQNGMTYRQAKEMIHKRFVKPLVDRRNKVALAKKLDLEELTDINEKLALTQQAIDYSLATLKEYENIAAKLEEAYRMSADIKTAIKNTPYPSSAVHLGNEGLQKRGIMSETIRHIKSLFGIKDVITDKHLLRYVELFGADNNFNLHLLRGKKTPIKELDLNVLSKKGVDDGVIVKYKGDYYLSRTTTKELPHGWSMGVDGVRLPSGSWAKLGVNQTLDPVTNTLMHFRESQTGVFTALTKEELASPDFNPRDYVHLNVQNYTTKTTLDQAMRDGFDAILVSKPNQPLRFKLLNRDFQAFYPNQLKDEINISNIVETKKLPYC